MQSGKSATKAVARVPKSATDVTAWIIGKDTAGARLYAQMRADGGTTGGIGLSTREIIDLELKTIIKEKESVPFKAWKKTIRAVDSWNRIFEDSTRLASYKQALENGLTREQSAFIAKNVTVNFNTKGTASPLINALYMFANASVQGQTRTLKSLRNPKTLAIVSGMVGGLVFMSRERNDMIDEKWEDKVSNWDKNHSIVFVLPEGEDGKFRYITVPVSWGLKPLKILMDRVYDAYNGKLESVAQGTADVAVSFIDAYNPIGGSDFFSAITPTPLDIPVEVARNKAWHGGMIYPAWKQALPASERIFESTNETLKGKTAIQVADQLSEINIELSSF